MASFDSCLNKQFWGSHMSLEQSSTPPPSKNWSGSVCFRSQKNCNRINQNLLLFVFELFVHWSFPTYLRLMPGGNQPPYIHAWVLGSATEMALQRQSSFWRRLKIRLFYDAKEMSTSALALIEELDVTSWKSFSICPRDQNSCSTLLGIAIIRWFSWWSLAFSAALYQKFYFSSNFSIGKPTMLKSTLCLSKYLVLPSSSWSFKCASAPCLTLWMRTTRGGDQ